MANPQPTLAGFIAWVRAVMGVGTDVLPDNDPVLPFALAVAMGVANPALMCAPIPSMDAAGVTLNAGGYNVYVLAVYNLGGDNLVNFAQDAPDAPPYKDGLPFWAYMRKQFNVDGFVSGVIQSTGDQATSASFVVQKAAEDFTLANLQNLKTPWGRRYLAFAQSYGPTVWGLTR